MIFDYQKISFAISRPIIPIFLRSKTKYIFYSALIDSGADYCIFSIELAKALDIKLSKSKTSFKGVGKDRIQGRWGKVDIRIDHIVYQLKALFAEISDFGHGILGQKGFFDHFDVELSYRKLSIEIKPVMS